MLFVIKLCSVTGYATATPAMCFGLFMWQWFSHSAIDWFKGRLNVWHFSLNDATRPAHWVVFGLDQYAHTVVIILMWHFATL